MLKKIKSAISNAPTIFAVALLGGITMAMGGSTGLVVGIVGLSVYLGAVGLIEYLSRKSS